MITSLQQTDWRKSIQISLLKRDNKTLKSKLEEESEQNKTLRKNCKCTSDVPSTKQKLLQGTGVTEASCNEEEFLHITPDVLVSQSHNRRLKEDQTDNRVLQTPEVQSRQKFKQRHCSFCQLRLDKHCDRLVQPLVSLDTQQDYFPTLRPQLVIAHKRQFSRGIIQRNNTLICVNCRLLFLRKSKSFL